MCHCVISTLASVGLAQALPETVICKVRRIFMHTKDQGTLTWIIGRRRNRHPKVKV